MRGLSGKTAVVTGAGSGIGRAIARRLGDEGVTVAVNDVAADRASDTVDAIEADGGDAMTAVCDVTDYDAVAATVEDVAAAVGPISVLVNNAGWDRMEWFLEQDPDVWDRIIDVNYRGQVNCAHVVGRHMVAHDVAGSIVGIASDAGRVGSSAEAVYAGTKGGVIAFTKTLARELARHEIRCNVVAPGPTQTSLTDEMREESDLADSVLDAIADQTPLGNRMARAEEIAGAVAFFASEDAGFMTGQVVSVSGGLTMAG